jgi:hypothetical protein
MNNPLISRYRLSAMRPRQFLVHLATYAIVTALIFLINGAMLSERNGYETFREMAHSLYFQFFIFQAVILWFWAGHNAYSAIRDEVTDHSYDFFRLLPLSARDKTVGILVGKNLAALLFAGLNFVFLLASGYAGRVPFGLQCQILLLLATSSVLFSSASLLSSLCTVQKDRRRMTGLTFVVALLLAVWSGLGWIVRLASATAHDAWTISFFAASVPGALLLSAVTLYLGAWALLGVVRKFDHERETLFTPSGALRFCAGYQVLVLGFFWAPLQPVPHAELSLCWAFGFAPLLMLLSASLRSHAAYMESCGQIMSAGRTAGRFLAQKSNLTLGFALYALWAVAALGESALTGHVAAADALGFLGVFFTAYAFVLLLIELHVLYSPSIPRIKILLGVVLLLYVALPPIFAGIFKANHLFLYSPLVYFFSWQSDNAIGAHRICAANLLLCAWPAYLVQKKYREILALRRQMKDRDT